MDTTQQSAMEVAFNGAYQKLKEAQETATGSFIPSQYAYWQSCLRIARDFGDGPSIARYEEEVNRFKTQYGL